MNDISANFCTTSYARSAYINDISENFCTRVLCAKRIYKRYICEFLHKGPMREAHISAIYLRISAQGSYARSAYINDISANFCTTSYARSAYINDLSANFCTRVLCAKRIYKRYICEFLRQVPMREAHI